MLQPKTAIRQIQYISDNLPYIDHHPHSPVSILLLHAAVIINHHPHSPVTILLLHAAVIINSTGDHHPHSPVTILILSVIILSQKATATEKLNRRPSSTQSGHYLIITSKKNLNPHLTCLRGNSFTSVRQNTAEK